MCLFPAPNGASSTAEQSRIQEELVHRDAELREAQRLAHVGSGEWDITTGTITWSEELYRIFGRDPTLPAPSYAETRRVFTAESFARLSSAMESAVKSGQPYELDVEFIRPDGTTGWVTTRAEPVRDASGRIVKVRGTAQDITERKRMETALQNAKDYAENLIRTANVMVVQLDTDGNIRLFNQAAERLTGYSQQEVQGRNWFEVLTPKARYPHVWAEFRRLLSGGFPRNFENAILTKAGEERFIAWQNNELREQGRITGTISFGLDMTERRKTEVALRESEQRLRESDATLRRLKDADIIGIIQGEQQQITDANDVFLQMVGYEREDLETKRLVYPRMTPPEYKSLDEHAMAELRTTGAIRPYEKEYFRKDGSRIPVLLGGASLADNSPRWICFVLDLSEQKKAEAERVKLAALVQNSSDFIGVAAIDGTALFLNAAGRRLVGLEAEDPLPPVAGYLYPEGADFYLHEVLPKLLSQGRWVGEYVFRHCRTHEPIDVLWDCFVVKDPDTGTPMCVATVTRDIREQKRSQRMIQQSKEALEHASRAKDQFIAALSHELRTPLTPVLAAVQMMERAPSLNPELRDGIGMIHRNVALEARLIDDLLDLTRISRGKLELHLEVTDLHSLLRHVVIICNSDLRSKQLHLSASLDAGEYHVLADAARLQQVVWNLLKNAIKFTPRGGKITLRTDQPSEGRVAVTVSDTGVGIDPELLPRIFDAFEQGERETTRRFGGLGLGLTISKGIVDMHGGTLTALSQGKGTGASFRMELATVPATRVSTPPGTAVRDGHAPRKSGRLLVVEDHPDTRTLMARLLRHAGYEVRTTDSVAGAIRSWDAEDFDLILCDIGLPDGSGLDLMRQIRATHGPVRAIAMSGFGMEEDIRQSREAGFAEHLTKPVDVNRLEETIDRVMGETTAHDPRST